MDELVRLEKLTKAFPQKRKQDVVILRDIDLTIKEGETLCVLGESGCGKTTLGKILAGLSTYSSGSYQFCGEEVRTLRKEKWDSFRNHVQMIHQNPYESLNPAMMVFDMIANPIRRHKHINDIPTLYKKVTDLLELVGLTPVEDFVDKYPNALSGGQRQRVSIARILAMDPKLIVVDEATSMIDTSLRISLLKTLVDIQTKLNVSYFFITHDLALGRYFARGQKAMIMYLGRIVEESPADELISKAAHPYTRAILSAASGSSEILQHAAGHYELLEADVPSFTALPSGCVLHPRCPQRIAGLCDRVQPGRYEVSPQHFVSCHLYAKDRV